MATLYGEIEVARRCYEVASKGLNCIITLGKKSGLPESSEEPKPLPHVKSVYLDNQIFKDSFINQKESEDSSTNPDNREGTNPWRPIPNADFELILLGDDPNKWVKIGTNIPNLRKKQLKACLIENADLLVWCIADMPRLDPKITCLHLIVDPTIKVVTQCRCRQSSKKWRLSSMLLLGFIGC